MATRDLIAEFKALRLHGMAATWTELSDQGGAEIEAARWVVEQMMRSSPLTAILRASTSRSRRWIASW
jgi:hypothetical protein